MVLTKQAEAAAIDANALACNKNYLQDEGKDIQVLHSIGPLPPYPVVVNNRLDSEYGCWQSLVLLFRRFRKP
jgi:ABC-type phosphate/phosphonate transport system substrate-binding protein